jgi:hypothetical protein
MNQNTVDQLAERIINETNSAVSCLTLYLDHKLDLFNSLGKEGPVTSEELSKKIKYSERYMREWFECMTANGYINHDPITKRVWILSDLELSEGIKLSHLRLDIHFSLLSYPLKQPSR